MLQTLDEVRKADFSEGKVINGVDNANVLSVNSIEPIQTEVDEVVAEEELSTKAEKTADKVEEKTEKKKTEEKVEEKKEEAKLDSEVSSKQEEKKSAEEKHEVKEAVEKRIGNLTKKWRTAERERDFEKTKRLELEKELQSLKAKVPASDKPQRADFEDEDAFLEALADWKVDVKLNAKLENSAKETKEEEAKRVAAEVQEGVDAVTEKGRDKYSDYEAVVFDKNLSLNQSMVETILGSEIAEDMFYFLGQNPDLSEDIASLKPLLAAKELGRIEDRLLAGIPKMSVSSEGKEDPDKKEERREIPAKKLTKTPEPITPVKSTGAIDKDPSTMTAAEYRAWREKKG